MTRCSSNDHPPGGPSRESRNEAAYLPPTQCPAICFELAGIDVIFAVDSEVCGPLTLASRLPERERHPRQGESSALFHEIAASIADAAVRAHPGEILEHE